MDKHKFLTYYGLVQLLAGKRKFTRQLAGNFPTNIAGSGISLTILWGVQNIYFFFHSNKNKNTNHGLTVFNFHYVAFCENVSLGASINPRSLM